MTIQATVEKTDPTPPTPIGGLVDGNHRRLIERFTRPDGNLIEFVESGEALEIIRVRVDRPPVVMRIWRSEAEGLLRLLPAFLVASREAIVARPRVGRGIPRGSVSPQPKAVRR